jgi:hypothetical protein
MIFVHLFETHGPSPINIMVFFYTLLSLAQSTPDADQLLDFLLLFCMYKSPIQQQPK